MLTCVLCASLIIGGNALDATSTIYGLKNGAVEMNPIYGPSPSPMKVIVIKSASTLATLWVTGRIAKSRPKLAKALAVGIFIGLGAVSAHNFSVGSQ